MKYVLKKFVSLIITLVLVSLIAFLAFNVIPGDPATLIAGANASPDQITAIREQLGLNQSLPVRYLSWIGGFIRGDFGRSLRYSMPVSDLIASRIPVTLWLTALSFLLILIISIPLGVYSAKKRGKWADTVISTLNNITMGIPPFFLGILFILLFGIVLKLFVPGKYIDYNTDFIGFLLYLIFPALAIALPKVAITVKFLRTSIIEQLQSGYVTTARSKGNLENAVLYRHVLKNALVPVISLLGMIIAEILAGSIIIEQVFGLPGIGRLLVSSITARDFPLAETIVVLIAVIVVIINFLVDVIFRIIDPRIRFE